MIRCRVEEYADNKIYLLIVENKFDNSLSNLSGKTTIQSGKSIKISVDDDVLIRNRILKSGDDIVYYDVLWMYCNDDNLLTQFTWEYMFSNLGIHIHSSK